MSSREDTPEPGTSAASTSQAAPQGSSQESAACPECRDISTVCSSSCRHCFCQLCLWDWSLGQDTCPRCQRPTRHPYPQHVALYHEVQDRVYNSKQRWQGHSAWQPWGCSGRSGHRRPWERRRRRSTRWPRHGHWQAGHSRGGDSPRRRRRWQHRRDGEGTHGEGRAPRSEQAGSRGSWSWQEGSRGHSRRSRGRECSHGWDRWQGWSSRRDQDTRTGSHDRSARQRRRRSRDAEDRHTPTPQHDAQWEDSDSSTPQHSTRSRARGRSRRRSWDTETSSEESIPRQRSRRRRNWNAGRGRAPRSQRDTGRRQHRHQHRDT